MFRLQIAANSLVSLALAARHLKCKHFFNFFLCLHANLFCEESSQKIDAKDVERLKAMITLEQANTSVKTSMVRV